MANNINIVITAEDKASKPIRSLSDEMDGASGKSSKFKSALGALGGVLKTAAIAGGIAAAAFAGTGAALGFNFNSQVEQATAKLNAFMQDNERVAKTLAWVKNEAALTQFSFTDMADAAASLTPVAKMSGKSLEELIKQAEVLASLNPAEGLSGAVFSLREALTGDWVSIVDRFNLPRKRINDLKAQGVPAMEIISKTLGEMGITYDLVSKQGQTTAARFDQIKDKLTMMAGAAAKPIFDRVSSELGTLGNYDFTSLGDKLAGIVSGGISAFDAFVPKLKEVASQIGDYLSPKLQTLWSTVQDKLAPALQKLWKEVLEPLIPVIGNLAVSALGGLIDALNLALTVLSPFISFLADNQWVLWGFVGGLAAIRAGMAFDAAVSGAIVSLNVLRAAVALPIVMPAIAIGAAIAAIALVWQKYQETMQAIEQGQKQVKQSQDATEQLRQKYEAAKKSGNEGEISKWKKLYFSALDGDISVLKSQANTRFAAGTNSSPGGWAVVGEHGPEMVKLPTGSGVTPAYQTRSDRNPSSGGATVVIEQFISNNGQDNNRFLRDIGFTLANAS